MRGTVSRLGRKKRPCKSFSIDSVTITVRSFVFRDSRLSSQLVSRATSSRTYTFGRSSRRSRPSLSPWNDLVFLLGLSRNTSALHCINQLLFLLWSTRVDIIKPRPVVCVDCSEIEIGNGEIIRTLDVASGTRISSELSR